MAFLSPLLNLFRSSRKPASHLVKDFGETLAARWFGVNASATGVHVTPDTAMRAAAVFSCVRILSESVASLPLHLYRRINVAGREGKERAKDHPLYRVLHTSPNDEQTSFEWREMLQGHLSLRGNGFSFVDWARGGRVRRLMPMHPDRMDIRRKTDGKLVYEYRRLDGRTEYYDSDEILHLRGLADDGVRGLSPIEVAREAVGLSLATEDYGAKFFANGTHMGAYLETDQQLDERAQKNLKESLAREHGGLANAHKMPVFEQGLKLQRLNMTAEDAQFLESRKFQIGEIARIFRVPPHKIYDLERATFSNIEQQSIDFVTDSIMPWLVRWEQRLSKTLLKPSEQDEYFFEFNMDALLRGETKARQESLQIMRRNGILNANEWRAKENMNPIEGPEGESFFQDKSMTEDPEKKETDATDQDE